MNSDKKRNVELFHSLDGNETFLVSRNVLELMLTRSEMGETEHTAPISIEIDDYNEMPIYRFSIRKPSGSNGGSSCPAIT